ncbi:creatininase family protein [Coraliomargarita parva]|uniref:creatininase family protein n=1 Tax=Coraliomargarita parva TaxID=3014050 RepID=UPI0022B474B7|nr:creatininase family protein [Coraliomargarita parva]
MTDTKHSQWEAMTWPEILECIGDGCDAAILPLGATEQHGPHLGTGMDSVLADKLCREVGGKTGVPVLPVLSYGCSIGHSHRWPGTVALSPTTMIAVLCDMGDWLYQAGIRRLFLVNSHVGNAASVRCALDTLRCRYDDLMVAGWNTGTLTPVIEAAFTTDGEDWHANAAETSLMMAVAPEMVREDKLAESDDPDRTGDCVFSHPVNRTSTNGVTGKPSEASVFGGQRLFEHLVNALVSRVEHGLRETPPLDASYFKRI